MHGTFALSVDWLSELVVRAKALLSTKKHRHCSKIVVTFITTVVSVDVVAISAWPQQPKLGRTCYGEGCVGIKYDRTSYDYLYESYLC